MTRPDPFLSLRARSDIGGASKLLLDRHAAGEALTPDEAAAVARALERDPAARAHVEAVRAEPIDPADVARLQRTLAEPPARAARPARGRAWWGPVGAVLVAAAVFLVVRRPSEPDAGGMDGVRTKGGHAFEIVVRAAEDAAVRRLLPDEALHPGDAVRFQVAPKADVYVAIVGLDSAGAAAVYAPAEGPPVRVARGATHVFEGSIVLDATLGRERFTALFCREPLPRAALSEAIDALGRAADGGFERRLELPGCDEVTFVVKKVPAVPRP